MKPGLFCAYVVGMSLCALCACRAVAAQPLAALAQAAQHEAPAVHLARAEVDLAQRRLELARTGNSVRVFGAASLAGAREAVTEKTSRDYRRVQAQVGLRWSLGAASARRQRDILSAELDSGQAQQRLRLAQRDALLALRQAYVRHLHSVQRIALAESFLSSRADAEQQLHARHAAHTLLEAERLALLGLFDGVQVQHAAQQVARTTALRQIERLTGQASVTPETRAPFWPAACIATQALLARADDQPGVVQAQHEAALARRQRDVAELEGIEAGASLSQSASRDFGGQPGRNTFVGVDFSMPVDWRAQRDAARAQALAAQSRAESLVQLRREEFIASVQQAAAQWQLRQDEYQLHTLREQAEREAVRVALLRLPAFDGDGYGRLLAARHALLQAQLAGLDGAERLDMAAADLLALAGDCDAVPDTLHASPGPNPNLWSSRNLLEQPAHDVDEAPP